MAWIREVTREPQIHSDERGFIRCSYCGDALCFPVPGLDPTRVASAHYAREWRKHTRVTRGRSLL